MEEHISLHIAMCPWYALGHITPYLHISNKLAQKGHKISFLIPTKTQHKVQHLNRFPDLITFVPISVPHVSGLPPAAETTSDVPKHLFPLIAAAMDLTEPAVEPLLLSLKPHLVFHDLAHWVPSLARRLGIKSVHLAVVKAAAMGFNLPPDRTLGVETMTVAEQMKPPPGFPDPSIKLRLYEARNYVERRHRPFGGLFFFDRLYISISECDAIAFKACKETDGPFGEYLGGRFGKSVLHAGPVIPEPSSSALEERLATWLARLEPELVVYCALGSEWILERAQLRELLAGLELSGLPFLAALKPPLGAESVEEAMPEGFLERVGERGVVCGGWVQQQLILEHPSVGCFLTHCGSGSMTEALANPCQLVMIPHEGDHIFQARMIGNTLRAGVEVERRDEDGFFWAESVSKAIKTVMDREAGREVTEAVLKQRFGGSLY